MKMYCVEIPTHVYVEAESEDNAEVLANNLFGRDLDKFIESNTLLAEESLVRVHAVIGEFETYELDQDLARPCLSCHSFMCEHIE